MILDTFSILTIIIARKNKVIFQVNYHCYHRENISNIILYLLNYYYGHNQTIIALIKKQLPRGVLKNKFSKI